MGEFGIGQPVERFEDPRLLRGEGRFVDDLQLPGQAHLVLVRSPHAHARIAAVDLTAARAAPACSASTARCSPGTRPCSASSSSTAFACARTPATRGCCAWSWCCKKMGTDLIFLI